MEAAPNETGDPEIVISGRRQYMPGRVSWHGALALSLGPPLRGPWFWKQRHAKLIARRSGGIEARQKRVRNGPVATWQRRVQTKATQLRAVKWINGAKREPGREGVKFESHSALETSFPRRRESMPERI